MHVKQFRVGHHISGFGRSGRYAGGVQSRLLGAEHLEDRVGNVARHSLVHLGDTIGRYEWAELVVVITSLSGYCEGGAFLRFRGYSSTNTGILRSVYD